MDAGEYGKARKKREGEERRFMPYLVLVTIGVLASVVLLDLWKGERASSMAAMVAENEKKLSKLVADISVYFDDYAERGREFAVAVARDAARDGEVSDGTKAFAAADALFGDPRMHTAWIALEPDPARNRQRLAIRYSRDGGVKRESDDKLAADIMEGGAYLAFRSRNAARVMPGTRVEMGDYPFTWQLGARPNMKTISKLLVEVPVYLGEPGESGGNFAGGAGFEVDIPEIGDRLEEVSWSPRAEVFLVAPDGTVAMSPGSVFVGERYQEIRDRDYAEAFARGAAAAAEGKKLEPFASGSFTGDVMVTSAPIELADGSTGWFLLSMCRSDVADRNAAHWLSFIPLVWSVVVMVCVVVYARRRAKITAAAEAEVAQSLSPQAIEAFRQMEKKRGMCYLFSALFFLPAMFFIAGADKRYQEAKLAGDVRAAEKAVAGMVPIVAVCVVIGLVLLVLNFQLR